MIIEVYNANVYASLITSLSLNGALVFLIFYKTPTRMKQYGRMLMQTCIVDMLLSLASAIEIPVIITFLLNFQIFFIRKKYSEFGEHDIFLKYFLGAISRCLFWTKKF
jgi:hypothetical protein